jgi:hypothetical protein
MRVSLAALLGTAASGCGALVPGAGTGNCSINADNPLDGVQVRAENPHDSRGKPGWIVGKARITCTLAVDKVALKVRVEHRGSGGNWELFAENADEEGQEGTVFGSVAPGRQYTSQATNRCASGTFRTAARGYGILNGSRSASMSWEYSQVVTNPCKNS